MTNLLATDFSADSHSDTYAFPLSFAQQRLWFLHQLEPKNATYNIPTAYRLRGNLDITALQKSFDILIQRHEALRTTFSIREGEAKQIVHPSSLTSLLITDLRDTEISQRAEMLGRLLQDHARQPFDLEYGPLFRCGVIQINNDDHVLHLSMHHIISDGWSMGVFFKELTTTYSASRAGKASPLRDLPIQYADYAVWQRNWLVGEEFERKLSYWKKQLENLPTLELPTNRPRPPVQTFRGSSQSIELSAQLTQALKELTQREGTTLFMTLLAAFQTLLCRYCGQQDIAVGTPIAGRTRQETEGLIGFFVNTLVLRSDLSDNPSFKQLLIRVRQVALDAYDHQEIPFEKLVEELNPDRSMTTSPLFQVNFTLQNNADQSLKFEHLSVSPIRTGGQVAKFDLSLSMSDRQGNLRASLNYNTDLFDASTIERMLGHFHVLLRGIVSNPDQRISQLPLLTEAEKHQLLIEWNDTKRDYPNDRCVHQLFEEQVERTPDAVALVFDDQQLTYRDLNSRANQLAHYLRKLGVGPDVLVGICLERSIDMIVGLLAILKAGGAYVPLDPSYPKERIAFMVKNAQVIALLTQERLLSTSNHRTIVCLDRDWLVIAKEDVNCLPNNATSNNLAYVIYTSGSTGEPKAVMIPHRGLVNYLIWAIAAYGAADGQGAPLHSSIGFDLSITSIFTPLLSGRRLVLLPEDRAIEALSSLLNQETDFSLIKITPAHLEFLGQELPTNNLEHHSRALIIGGEALTFEKLALWSRHSPKARLINEYGPTETVVGCCVYEVSPGQMSSGPVPIGRPIANTQIYILDQNLQPVPIGVTGELHIGGAGLARGYLNRSDLTQEKFIANPFSNEPRARLYKTGDLARYLSDGNIEFLGRIDDQVKIRGYRIELSEIEAVLSQHPAIQQAVVLARGDTPGDRRLVAYTVATNGSNPSTHDLRSFLQQKLPDYMLPSAFVFLDSLPFTPNGKLDRKALPAPDQTRPELDDAFAAPRTPVQEILANIWVEVLKLDKVGIHDNFFHLGGHSLLATQVVSRINAYFLINLPLRRLFESPTIARLADSVQATIANINSDAAFNCHSTSARPHLFELKPGKLRHPVFFLPGGVGGDNEYIVYARLVHYVGDDHSFYGLRARSADGIENAHTSVEEMTADYLVEIQTVQPEGPYFLIGECIGGVVAFEIARQLETAGQKVALLVLMNTVRPSLRNYLRYRGNRVKQRLNNWFGSGAGYYVARSVYHSRQLWQLPWNKKLPYLIRKASVAIEESPNLFSSREANHFSYGSDTVREGYIDTLRRYRPKPYQGRVIMLNNAGMGDNDPTIAWTNLVLGGIDVRSIPGNHITYIRQYVRAAGETLCRCLNEAWAENSTAVSQTGVRRNVDIEQETRADWETYRAAGDT